MYALICYHEFEEVAGLPTRSGLPGCRDNAVTNTKSSTHGLDKGRQ